MIKKIISKIIVIIFFVSLIISINIELISNESNIIQEEVIVKNQFIVSNKHNADAKCCGDITVTSVGGKLQFVDNEGNVINTFDNIDAEYLSQIVEIIENL